MKLKMNRRDFLSGTSKLMITSMMSSYLPVLRAQSNVNKKMIHIHFEDGAHQLLGLDPLVLELLANRKLDPIVRDDREFIPMYEDSDLIKTNHFLLGPAAAELAKYSQDISIVAGIQGVSISHSENARFNMSGDEDGRDNIILAEAYNQIKSGTLGIGVNANSIRDEFNKFKTINLTQIASVQTLSSESQRLSLRYQAKSAAVQQMVSMQSKLMQFQDTSRELRTRYPMPSVGFNSSNVYSDLVAAMKLDLNNFNFISLSNGLDTHSDHGSHRGNLGQLMQQVATLIEMLKVTEGSSPNSSLFDETLILITTDFGRTAYNQNTGTNPGTDHNPRNTTFMLSGGLIKGGVKVGESTLLPRAKSASGRTDLVGVPLDFRTEKPISYQNFVSLGKQHSLEALGSKVGFVFPGHVMATICAALEIEAVGKAKKYQPLTSLLKR